MCSGDVLVSEAHEADDDNVDGRVARVKERAQVVEDGLSGRVENVGDDVARQVARRTRPLGLEADDLLALDRRQRDGRRRHARR